MNQLSTLSIADLEAWTHYFKRCIEEDDNIQKLSYYVSAMLEVATELTRRTERFFGKIPE